MVDRPQCHAEPSGAGKEKGGSGVGAKHLSRLPESPSSIRSPLTHPFQFARSHRAHFALVVGLIFLTACGGGGSSGPTPTPAAPQNGVLAVRASEWNFQPNRIVLRQGEQVRIEFQNAGEILHDFRVDGLTADVAESRSDGPLSAGQGDIFVSANAGWTGVLVFTPRQIGTFTFYCDIPRHRQLGMRGTLIVE